jgi:hypothetical protein
VEEGESGVIVNKSKIMAVLDTLKNAYANGNSQVSYNYSTSILYHSSVALGDADPIQVQVEFYPRNQEVNINPGLYMENPEENIYQQQGDFTSLRFEGIGTGGHDVLHIDVDSDNVYVLKNYLYGIDLEYMDQIGDSALDAAIDMNPGGAACNLAVRAYFHYLKNDNVLFPVSHNGTSNWGAPLCCPTIDDQGETVYPPESIFIGSVEWDGRANNIYNSFEDSQLSSFFEKIEKQASQTWKSFFDNIQEKANNGEIIIGVKHNLNDSLSGHIVVFMPEKSSYPPKIEKIIGGDIGVEKPYALEAGNPDDNEKKIKQFVGTNDEITRTTRPFIYYIYIK